MIHELTLKLWRWLPTAQCFFHNPGSPEHFELRKRTTNNLNPNRQSFSRASSRNRNGRQIKCVETLRITESAKHTDPFARHRDLEGVVLKRRGGAHRSDKQRCSSHPVY